MRYPIVMFVLSSILFAGNLFHINLHKKTLAAYEYTKEELGRCNSEYQNMVDYHETQGISNPFIECVSYLERDLCFEQTMTGCLGDIDPDTDGYNRQLVLCEFMRDAALKLEHEKKYGPVPSVTCLGAGVMDNHPNYFSSCAWKIETYEECLKGAAAICMSDAGNDKESLQYKNAYNLCDHQVKMMLKDRAVLRGLVELVQEDMGITEEEK